MESFRRQSPTTGSLSYLERMLSNVSTDQPDFFTEGEPYDVGGKGPLGLNLLYAPSDPHMDFVFVHGLGGGSRKTWSKTSNEYHYWPKEWLQRDPDFQHVRIHSFGYNADWGKRNGGVMTIHDFAKSLLGELQNNPELKKSDTRLVLIGHSMGGIVIKKAYILARQDPQFKELAARFHTMYFLATPHRGSDLSKTLAGILKVSFGTKAYVTDLQRNATSITETNDTFCHFAEGIKLCSFFETLESSLFIRKAMIVDRGSSTLGYHHEYSAGLNADHRGICKFDRPSDSNYKTLRNSLVTTIELISSEVSNQKHETSKGDIEKLKAYLGVWDKPDEDLVALEDLRTEGSCTWFTSSKDFRSWRAARSDGPAILWLSGNPATGKSVLTSHVIGNIQSYNLNCSYFFFKHGVVTKSSASDCLRSLAYQTALSCVNIRLKFMELEREGVTFDVNDEKAVWRRLFLQGIFSTNSMQPQYWIIDALDECTRFQPLLNILSKVKGPAPIRIFITSRRTHQIEQGLSDLGDAVSHQEMQINEIKNDIKLFISARMHELPVEDKNSRQALTERILLKSAGSFLWVRLVVEELTKAHTEEAVEYILNDIPADMNAFYQRIVNDISKERSRAKLAKAIFALTLCSSRALTLDELQAALKLDIKETVTNLAKSISVICGQLLVVDQQGRVQIVHQTVKDFLMRNAMDSEFMVVKTECDRRLALICFGVLSTVFGKRSKSYKFAATSKPATELPLTDYACKYFSDHLYQAPSSESDLMDATYDFLNTNVLHWIEYLAKCGDLHHITRAATNLKAYFERRKSHFPPIGKQYQAVEGWTTDLIRVAGKFKSILLTSPGSIHQLIPAMCPAKSVIAQRFNSPFRGLVVAGLSEIGWDDCLSQIDFVGAQATALGHGNRFFAVGLSNGNIRMYHAISGQLYHIFEQQERVKLVVFGNHDRYLASSGYSSLQMWDITSKQQLLQFDTSHQILSLSFTNEDLGILGATQGNYIIYYDISDILTNKEEIRIPWYDMHEDENSHRTQPTQTLISPDERYLVATYRNRPIMLFDIHERSFYGRCIRTSTVGTHSPVVALTFNPNIDINLLVASYADGELVVYDPERVELKHRLENLFAQILACSPNGRTLLTGSSFGDINLFEFGGLDGSELIPIYRIDSHEESLRSLTFSNDNLRFLVIRGSQCQIWEPAVLVRKALNDGTSSISGLEGSKPAPTFKSILVKEQNSCAAITAMVCAESGEHVFAGKDDGSIYVYRTADGLLDSLLCKHTRNIIITHICWDEKKSVLVSADESSRVIVQKIRMHEERWVVVQILFDHRFAESIRDLALHPSSSIFLVSLPSFDDIWTYDGALVASKPSPDGVSRKVFWHPSNAEMLLVMDLEACHIYRLVDFIEETSSDGIRLKNTVSTVKDSNLALSCYGAEIIVELVEVRGDQSSTRVFCWETSKLNPCATSLEALPGFDLLGKSIVHVIAVVKNRLLFIETGLWVCSLDLATFGKLPCITRHFFIPSNWQSSTAGVLIQLTSKGDFVIAVKNELAVVKRGLTYSDSILLENIQQCDHVLVDIKASPYDSIPSRE